VNVNTSTSECSTEKQIVFDPKYITYSNMTFRNKVNRIFHIVIKFIACIGQLIAIISTNNEYKSQQKQQKHICHYLMNTHQLLKKLLFWVHNTNELLSTHDSLCKGIGRYKIELNKFFIATFSTMIYFDIIAKDLIYESSSSSSCMEYYSIIVNTSKDDDIIDMRNNWKTLTDSLSYCVQMGYMSLSGMTRVIVSCSRPTIIGYYSLCKGLIQLKAGYPSSILSFLNRYGKYDVLDEEFSCSSSSVAHANNTADNDVNDRENWYHDPSTRQAIKQVMGADVAALISRLCAEATT
jgi:hypothetical protein